MVGVGHANNSGAHCWQLLCLEPWMNPNTRHGSRSGRCPGGAWAAPLQPQRGQGRASPEPRDAQLDEALPQVVLAPDEKDALRGGPNLGRRIPIARLVTTQGVDAI
jgi:hypothetical protein